MGSRFRQTRLFPRVVLTGELPDGRRIKEYRILDRPVCGHFSDGSRIEPYLNKQERDRILLELRAAGLRVEETHEQGYTIH